MKLIFTEPKPHPDCIKNVPVACWFPEHFLYMGDLFYSYMAFNGIYIGYEHKDFTIEYNYCYHFYDISLFGIPGNVGNPSKHIHQVIDFLKKEGVNFKDQGYTWRWENHVEIPGKRIWIYTNGTNTQKKNTNHS